MFTDKLFQVVSCNSEISTERTTETIGIQTNTSNYSQTGVQTLEKKNADIQTVPTRQRLLPVDYQKLALFLNKVTPIILKILDRTYLTNTFQGYETSTSEKTFEQRQLIAKIHTTRTKKISGLAWSPMGGTLAVSHSLLHHKTWCNHLTQLQFYRLSSLDQFIHIPQQTLEINSCVTSLSYHPMEPSILAAGLYNGDVLLWNLQNDDSITPINICTYTDSVSLIAWHANCLISSSSDGYILIHRINAPSNSIIHRFKIIKEYNPSEKTRPSSSGGSRQCAAEAGLCITCFDFSHQDSSILIVGTLCGGIYKCNTNTTVDIQGDNTLFDPVIDEYERHEGSVTCVKCSPNNSLFITTGIDKQIYIFNYNDLVSQKIIFLQDVAIGLNWVIGNPNVFIAYGAGPDIKSFNVIDAKPLAHSNFQRDDRENTSSLCFNFKSDFVAIGDTQGTLEIWKVIK